MSTKHAIRLLAIVFVIDVALRWVYWGDYAYSHHTIRRPHAAATAAAVPMVISALAGLIVLVRPTVHWFWPVPLVLIYFCIGYAGMNPENSVNELPNTVQMAWTSLVVMVLVWLTWFLRGLDQQRRNPDSSSNE